MKVLVEKGRHIGSKFHFRVIVNSDLPKDQQSIEKFVYGDDVPLSQIRSEFLALLRNKYEEPVEEVLGIEGQEFEV